jgi:polyether ionophore transport system permease protein
MAELTGTWRLTRFTVRRDRVRLAIWVIGVTALVVLTAASIKGLYPTQAELDAAAVASTKNAAVIAFNGPVQGLDTVGGEVAFQSGTFGLVLVALMSLLMTTRCTRAEEENGRTELLRAAVLGRYAEAASALLVVTALNAVIAVLVAAGLLVENLPLAGSVTFGASFLAVGVVFAALTLLTAQLSQSSRVASGTAGGVLGVAFALRAVGDIGDGRLSWLSPIGWSQKVRPFAGEVWWPFLIPLTVSLALLAGARLLSTRRDLGAGLVQPRLGPATASPALVHPLGLAIRLQRASVVAWAAGLALLGFVYGAVANDVQSFVSDNPTLEKMLAPPGGRSLLDAYLGTTMLVLALIGSGFAVQAVQRMRSEETALLAEPILATPVARSRWMAGYLGVSFGGSVLVMAAAGLGVGIPYAVEVHDAGQVPALVGAALVHLPAIWLLAGAANALFGLLPRALPAIWTLLTACFVVGFLGEVLRLPRWIMDLSPFQHTPQLPAVDLTLTPLAVLLAVALALTLTGAGAFRRRDLG